MAFHAFPAPRLHVLRATDAPVAAVLIRRSGWAGVARWDLSLGTVEVGQWLRGHLYERSCEVSPDGQFLYVFAMKGGKPYHAVSRLPWQTALAFWRDISTYHHPHAFERTTTRTGASPATLGAPHAGDLAPLTSKHRLALVNVAGDAFGGELRRGWIDAAGTHGRGERHLVRDQPGGSARLVLLAGGYSREAGAVDGYRPDYLLERADGTHDLPDVRWADWDDRGRLLVATSDGALQVRDAATLAVTFQHSLADVVPESRPAPKALTRW